MPSKENNYIIFRGFSGKWFCRKNWETLSDYGYGDTPEEAVEDYEANK